VIPLPEGKKEVGIQRGEVESLSTNSQPPEGPSQAEAITIVSGYCQAFHWDHLTAEDFDAAVVAELRESGSGRAVVQELAELRAKEKELQMDDNVITFPSCRWDGRRWWHGGKSYVHLGVLKDICRLAE
jgi:hypothetical protein